MKKIIFALLLLIGLPTLLTSCNKDDECAPQPTNIGSADNGSRLIVETLRLEGEILYAKDTNGNLTTPIKQRRVVRIPCLPAGTKMKLGYNFSRNKASNLLAEFRDWNENKTLISGAYIKETTSADGSAEFLEHLPQGQYILTITLTNEWGAWSWIYPAQVY